MWKIKPSQLESYRLFKVDKFDKTKEQFIEDLTTLKESESMRFGSEIHKFLELGESDYFEDGEIEQLTGFRSLMPDGIHEVKFDHQINDLYFSMVIDMVFGNQAHEYKTSSRFWGVDFFQDSIQWKAYLMASGLSSMTYHCITYYKGENGINRPCKFTYHKPFTFYPYPEMQNDVLDLSYEFVDFCKENEIKHIIELSDEQTSNK